MIEVYAHLTKKSIKISSVCLFLPHSNRRRNKRVISVGCMYFVLHCLIIVYLCNLIFSNSKRISHKHAHMLYHTSKGSTSRWVIVCNLYSTLYSNCSISSPNWNYFDIILLIAYDGEGNSSTLHLYILYFVLLYNSKKPEWNHTKSLCACFSIPKLIFFSRNTNQRSGLILNFVHKNKNWYNFGLDSRVCLHRLHFVHHH